MRATADLNAHKISLRSGSGRCGANRILLAWNVEYDWLTIRVLFEIILEGDLVGILNDGLEERIHLAYFLKLFLDLLIDLFDLKSVSTSISKLRRLLILLIVTVVVVVVVVVTVMFLAHFIASLDKELGSLFILTTL
jgi:hypothetical protein